MGGDLFGEKSRHYHEHMLVIPLKSFFTARRGGREDRGKPSEKKENSTSWVSGRLTVPKVPSRGGGEGVGKGRNLRGKGSRGLCWCGGRERKPASKSYISVRKGGIKKKDLAIKTFRKEGKLAMSRELWGTLLCATSGKS